MVTKIVIACQFLVTGLAWAANTPSSRTTEKTKPASTCSGTLADLPLIPMDTFLQEHTSHGFLLNGKPTHHVIEDMAGRFHFTDRNTAGYGIFTTKSHDEAISYMQASTSSLTNVSLFRVSADHPLRVLAYKDVMRLPEAKFKDEAGNVFRRPDNEAFKAVGEAYALDAIIDYTGAVVFQNTHAFRVPKNWNEHARWLRDYILYLPSGKRLNRLIEYAYASSFKYATNKSNLPGPPELRLQVGRKLLEQFKEAQEKEAKLAVINYRLQNYFFALSAKEYNWLIDFRDDPTTPEKRRERVKNALDLLRIEPGISE